ncbi:Inositol 2-dehydrogenase/D-chiro-inositol 3-dehydrogenase [Pleomorphomonas sp. T1.2MG-36]|uniref:Gfo/Idh/MocA family protein n=1 Tax=Pleomorphomonas sp. T1.2MG-36 TaxID=3041167 RepID=UPI0024776D7C|nr:Gfo/Idh/MocA family oxidoreductase [Pleomorphomonas sp. T1.2MG-36]CAI9399335.1 Inositol 2-dehydrogenase/D-chiro-inositol 3-dehydrogenase [Pleomorphomonas sp. T1.2MG-36]
MSQTRIKLAMVGGGATAFIGAVHRIAMRLDDRFELVAGALDVDAERGRAFAATLGIAPDRAYATYQELIDKEALRPDRVDAVVIVTPNFLHYPIAKAALEAGFDVICEKPMTTTLDDAKALAALVQSTGRRFFLTHTYTGYPMVRQAREMIAAGEIGKLRRVEVEYLQDWLAAPVENTGAEGAVWRTDPKKAGVGGAIGDVGTHAWNLAAFVAGEEPTHLLAELSTLVEGRRVDDDAAILLRYASGAKGSILASQVLPGNGNNVSFRIYGDKAGLEWWQEKPEELWFTRLGEPRQMIRRNGAGATSAAIAGSRVPAAHPEGYLEAFANLYRDAADVLSGKAASTVVPTALDGVSGSKFVEACLKSNAAGNVWTEIG